MPKDDWEKTVAVCEGCETLCTAWVLPDGRVVPISSPLDCDCDEPILRALAAETVFSTRESADPR